MESGLEIIKHYQNLSLENIEGEIWKFIEGFEDSYQVSNFGRIKSLARIVKGHKSTIWRKEMIKRQCRDKDGYNIIGLHSNSKMYTKKVHRLIAIAFIPNPENKPFINHKNAIKLDNSIENLEWCTQKENDKHALDMGLLNPPSFWLGKKGKDNVRSKPIFQYDLKGNFIQKFDSVRIAAESVGGHQSAISRYIIRRNKKVKALKNNTYGYHWSFK